MDEPMTKKPSALFLSIAQRCHERGECGRAVVTIINAFRNRPEFVTSHPESLCLLAECLTDGFEDEINRLLMRHPQIGSALNAALISAGREAFACRLGRSFEAFCIEQMKASQRHPSAAFPNYMGVDFYPPHRANSSSVPSFSAASASDSSLGSSSYPDFGMRLEAATAPQFIIPVVRPRARSAATSTASGARFERIRGETISERFEVQPYADAPNERCIVDFDSRIEATPKHQTPDLSLTPFRPFAAELEQFRQLERQEAAVAATFSSEQLSPLETVAETTHKLSDTPSVEPYCVRHPRRFAIRQSALVVSVLLCVAIAFSFIAFQSASVNFEQTALAQMGEAYFLLAQGQGAPSFDRLPDKRAQALVGRDFVNGYALFLDAWQSKHYLDHQASEHQVLPDLNATAPEQVAYIMALIEADDVGGAQIHLESLPRELWRSHPYFKLWALAQIDEATGQYLSASKRYEALSNGPLALFATTRLGVLAIESGLSEIERRFLSTGAKAGDRQSYLAHCARLVLEGGRSDSYTSLLVESAEVLAEPYAQYCELAKVFSALSQNRAPEPEHLQAVETMSPLHKGELYRLEALVLGELANDNPSAAVKHYREMQLPQGHPKLQRLRQALIVQALHTARWAGLNALAPDLPKDMTYLEAAHVIDADLSSGRSYWAERSLRIGEDLPLSSSCHSGAIYESYLEGIYTALYEGRYEAALTQSLSLRSTYPAAWEPVYLHAMAHAHQGRESEAAGILEHRAMQSTTSLSLVVMAQVYRARADKSQLQTSLLLKHLRFDDPALEAARCEVLWRQGLKQAKGCIERALKNPQRMKSLIVMSEIDRPGRWSSQELKRAGLEGMSFPGYHKAYAASLELEDRWREASKAYQKAILWDPTTADADSISKLSALYLSRYRRYEGAKHFEAIIKKAEAMHINRAALGALHYEAARLYNPKLAHSSSLIHLRKAHELLGDNKEILRGFIQFYEKKEKPLQVKIWRQRLAAFSASTPAV